MFTYNFYEQRFAFLSYKQHLLFTILVKLIWVIDIPLFTHLPLLNYANNFLLIKRMAWKYSIPQKFIDFSIDQAEKYYYAFNTNSEIIYYFNIIINSPSIYWTHFILICFLMFWNTRKKNFIWWLYTISLPFIFLCIFLFIDYLDGYFD